MGVRVTDQWTVALYDSTTGEAFGPLFDGEREAQDFLDWLYERAKEGLKFQYGNEELSYQEDARLYRPSELQHLYHTFVEAEDNDNPNPLHPRAE